jgi:hypothetical protein
MRPNERLDSRSTRSGEGLNLKGGDCFIFLTSLTQEKNYAQDSRFDPQITVSFFNELATERKTMLRTSVSFFNELATEKRNYARATPSMKASGLYFIF